MDEPASFDSIGNLTVRFDLFIKAGRDGERKRKRLSQLQTSVVNMGWSQVLMGIFPLKGVLHLGNNGTGPMLCGTLLFHQSLNSSLIIFFL